jgi:hypothetical protein
MVADHGSIRVSMDYCFSGRARGDKVTRGPSAEAATTA